MEEKEFDKENALFKLQLKSFLCGVRTCVDMFLDLLEFIDNEYEEDNDFDFESALREMFFDEKDAQEKGSTKIIETTMSSEQFKDFIKTLTKNNKEEK